MKKIIRKAKLIISAYMYASLIQKDYIVPITTNYNQVNELFNTKTNKTIKLLRTIYI